MNGDSSARSLWIAILKMCDSLQMRRSFPYIESGGKIPSILASWYIYKWRNNLEPNRVNCMFSNKWDGIEHRDRKLNYVGKNKDGTEALCSSRGASYLPVCSDSVIVSSTDSSNVHPTRLYGVARCLKESRATKMHKYGSRLLQHSTNSCLLSRILEGPV